MVHIITHLNRTKVEAVHKKQPREMKHDLQNLVPSVQICRLRSYAQERLLAKPIGGKIRCCNSFSIDHKYVLLEFHFVKGFWDVNFAFDLVPCSVAAHWCIDCETCFKVNQVLVY